MPQPRKSDAVSWDSAADGDVQPIGLPHVSVTEQGPAWANPFAPLDLGALGLGGAKAPLPAPAQAPVEAPEVTGMQAAKGGNAGTSGGGGGGGTSNLAVLTSYTTGQNNGVPDTAEYNVEIVFKGGLWTTALQDAFKVAADKIASWIIGDVPSAMVVIDGVKTKVDDIRINAELQDIDGLYGILGMAGPTAQRADSALPAAARMLFDIADASSLLADGYWDEVVLHEMLHSVGFGCIWDAKGLVQQVSATEAWYTGANGNAAYRAALAAAGTPDPAARIAVETDGGPGTALSHWDEATFGTELMTGWLNTGPGVEDPLTTMSIASLADLGYKIASQYMFA